MATQKMMPEPERAGVIRSVLKWGVWLSLAAGIVLPFATPAAQSNPIVVENQQPGTTQWRFSGPTATDAASQIKGYASAASIDKGESITFYVSTNPAQNYTIDVYRMGWYQGLGGRLMQHIGPLAGVSCPDADTCTAVGWADGSSYALGCIGKGSVTATSDPANATEINCGTTCAASYDWNTVVTLRAKPALGSLFLGWRGCDTVSGSSCKVTIGADRAVTATFQGFSPFPR